MIAADLIASDIPSLSVAQTGKDAFHLLGDHHVKHLPVVAEGRLVGILAEEDIFNHKLYEPISTYDFSLMRVVAIQANEHILEVVRSMGEHRLTILPVIDRNGHYLGLIRQNEVIRAFANMEGFGQMGGVLVLRLPRRDYSLAMLARIVEEEDAKILGTYLSSIKLTDKVEVTLKVDRPEMQRLVASLERYGYEVVHTYPEEGNTDNMRERYESLMHYLNT